MNLKKCHRIYRPALRLLAAPFAVLCFQSILTADQFTLRDGRVLTGKLVSPPEKIDKVNPDKKSAPTDLRMIVEIEDGVQVVIHKSDLVLNGHREIDPREEKYQQQAKGMRQSAETHYNVARWCSTEGLRELAKAHYLRAIELNPDYSEARSAVEHKQSDSGRWIRVEDHMHRMGKVEVGSKWIYPEYAIEDMRQAEEDKNVKAIKKEIEAFHQAFLKGSPKLDQALAAVEQLNDPVAIEVFAGKLSEKVVAGKKPIPDPLKLVYIRLLSKFDNATAINAIAISCIFDSSEPIRNAALDLLLKNGRGRAIDRIRGLLNARTSSNETINRAAFALGKLDASEATLDLINALVTKHEVAVRPQADLYSTEGTAMGGPKKAMVDFKNENVRNALSQITGQGSLGYDKAAWLTWFANIYASPVDDLRRDF